MSKHDDMLLRCDRCGAESKWQVVIGTEDLMFCNHHYAKYRDVLELHEVKALVAERVTV